MIDSVGAQAARSSAALPSDVLSAALWTQSRAIRKSALALAAAQVAHLAETQAFIKRLAPRVGDKRLRDPEFQRRIKARRAHIPYRRMGTEAEVSAAICFLLSEAATYITGVVLPVDGGLRLAKHLYPVPEHQAIAAYDPFGRSELPDWLRDAPNGSE